MNGDTPTPRAPFFTLSEVVALERYAWHDSDGRVFLFDGISLWRQDGEHRGPAQLEDAPVDGWWHRADCNCTPCESHRSVPAP